jgi:hypothetical protein
MMKSTTKIVYGIFIVTSGASLFGAAPLTPRGAFTKDIRDRFTGVQQYALPAPRLIALHKLGEEMNNSGFPTLLTNHLGAIALKKEIGTAFGATVAQLQTHCGEQAAKTVAFLTEKQKIEFSNNGVIPQEVSEFMDRVRGVELDVITPIAPDLVRWEAAALKKANDVALGWLVNPE